MGFLEISEQSPPAAQHRLRPSTACGAAPPAAQHRLRHSTACDIHSTSVQLFPTLLWYGFAGGDFAIQALQIQSPRLSEMVFALERNAGLRGSKGEEGEEDGEGQQDVADRGRAM
eukprot:gene11868-biopygen4147